MCGLRLVGLQMMRTDIRFLRPAALLIDRSNYPEAGP